MPSCARPAGPKRRKLALCAALALLACLAPSAAAAVELHVDPPAVDFGVVKPGALAQHDVLLHNPGADRLEVLLHLTGDNFAVAVDTVRLAPNGERRIAVEFSAADTGRFAGELAVSVKELFGSKDLTVPLSASVAAAALAIRPSDGLLAGDVPVGDSSRHAVELRNTGRVGLSLDSLQLIPADAGFRLVDDAPTHLPPSRTLTVDLDFAPRADGHVQARLLVHSPDLADPLEISLAGQGLAPTLAVSPLPEVGIDFGAVEVGNRSRRRLTLLNSGRADLEVTLQLTGDGFVLGADSLAVVEPGGRHDVEILCEPRYEGPAGGTIEVLTNDPSAPRVEVSLQAEAQVTPPDVRILNQRQIHFGAVPIGEPAREQLLLWNRGGSPFTTRLELDEGADAEFSLETRSVLLQPGESGKVELRFQPKEIGEREAVLWAETEAGRSRYQLLGTGKFLKLSPSSHDFGRVPVGESGRSVIELVNIGNADFTISGIRSTNEAFSVYTQVSPDSKFLLPANSLRSLPVSITFEPAARGLSTGTLRLDGFWEEGTETLEVLLNGTGVAAEIELHPTGALDFGYVVLGDSTMRTLVATNSGDTSLQVEANLLTREARIEPAAFSLQPGESTTLKVFFSPETLGERFGQILLVSNDVRDKAQPVKIKGEGALRSIDLAQITRVLTSRNSEPHRLRVPWNNTPLVVRDGTKIDLRFQVPDSLRRALVGRRIDIEWTQLDANYDPKGSPKSSKVQIYEDTESSLLAEDFNLRLKEAGLKRVRLKLTTHSYPGSPPQSVSQVFEAGGWKFEFEAKPLVSFLTIRPGRDWTDAEGNPVEGKTERLIGLPGIAFAGWHNAEHPLVSGVHLTAIGNVLEALQTNNSIAVSLGLAVSMYKDKFLFGFGWDVYDSRDKVKRKGSQDYIMTFKYSGLF